MNRFPEEHDLVEVVVDFVPYYGYVTMVDFDLRCPCVRVEFCPRGPEFEFEFHEISFVETPQKRVK